MSNLLYINPEGTMDFAAGLRHTMRSRWQLNKHQTIYGTWRQLEPICCGC